MNENDTFAVTVVKVVVLNAAATAAVVGATIGTMAVIEKVAKVRERKNAK